MMTKMLPMLHNLFLKICYSYFRNSEANSPAGSVNFDGTVLL